MTSPTLCQPRGTLPENTGKGGMKFKRESFPWGDLDLQNLSHKTTLESPNPGPLRLQQTLESPEAFNKSPIPGPHFRVEHRNWASAVLYALRFWKNWQSHLLEDLYNFWKIYLNLDNCLLSPKLIKSQGETEKKRSSNSSKS